jgi:hypothetical protein
VSPTDEHRGLPAGLSRGRDVDLRGRGGHVWIRRTGIGLLGAVSVAALIGMFGQQPSACTTSAPAATLTVHEPDRVRLGLLFQATIVIRARDDIDTPRLRLAPGWFEELQLKTVEPAPADERPAPGGDGVEWEFPPLRARDVLIVWLQYQANPAAPGVRDRSVVLFDGDRGIGVVRRELTVLP